jgi:hypothetical protein
MQVAGVRVMQEWNIDFQSVRPAGFQPAESVTAERISARPTGKMPMFRLQP